MTTLAEPGASSDDNRVAVARELLREAMGTRFGPYRLFEKLGRGGSGVVYRARRDGDDHDVALKRLSTGTEASDEERRAFLTGARTAAELEHSHIVPVLDIGEVDGWPYFTMQLVRGYNLASIIAAYKDRGERPSPGWVAFWMESMARTVAHAHHSGVLHRDLKPPNILIDEQGEPRVIDFGSAGRKVKAEGASRSHPPGLDDYTAPEQAMGERGQDSADIWALGVVMYQLLTNCVPYERDQQTERSATGPLATELASPDPVPPPRSRLPNVNPELELVCLKCLEKRPERRYRSADSLAEDLELIIKGFRPRHAPERATTRFGRWLLRQPTLLAVLGGILLVSGTALITARSFALTRDELEQSALETNGFIANSYAGALLTQLREYADRVGHAAQSPVAKQLLEGEILRDDAPQLEQFSRGFGHVYVASAQGQLLAQWPTPPPHSVIGRNYEFRDYFRGGQALGKAGVAATYLGRAYRAEATHQMQFAFSAPVMATDGAWRGMMIGALPVDSAIGKLNLRGPAESGRIVAVLGPRDNDRDRAHQPLPTDLCFVVHPRLERGREVYLRGAGSGAPAREVTTAAVPGEQFGLRWVEPQLISNYRDPVTGGDQEWLAAFAPVGQTGYVVVVQTTRDAVLAGSRSLSRKLFVNAGVPLALGIALLALLARLPAQRRKNLKLSIASSRSPHRPGAAVGVPTRR